MQTYNLTYIIQALRDAGWKPIESVYPWLIIPVEAEQETYYLSLCFYEAEKIIFVKGLVLTSIEKEQEELLMEFIQAGNHQLPISNFEYDAANKELNCRSGFYFNNMDLTTQLIHNLVFEIYDNVKKYKPILASLLEKQTTIDEIFIQGK